MINLHELRSEDLEKILKLRRKVEAIERRIAAILEKAGVAEVTATTAMRPARAPCAAATPRTRRGHGRGGAWPN